MISQLFNNVSGLITTEPPSRHSASRKPLSHPPHINILQTKEALKLTVKFLRELADIFEDNIDQAGAADIKHLAATTGKFHTHMMRAFILRRNPT